MRLFPTLLLLLGTFCAAGPLPGCGDSPQRPGTSSGLATAPPPAARPPADTAGCVFDVPALVNLTADQIQARLGKPLSDAQESANEQMHSLSYRRKGYELSIDYEVKSRRIIDVYFTPAIDTAWQAYARLLRGANITREEDFRLVHALNEKDGLYEGITITPEGSRVQDEFGHWVPRDSVL